MRKRAICGIVSIFSCFLVAAIIGLCCHAPLFFGASNYTLYLGNSSSARQIVTSTPVKDKLLYAVKGESGEYDGNCYEQLKEKFQARLLFCEEACGVKNYYLYSSRLGEGVVVNGQKINLHIAVKAEKTAVGTPLIFGGY